MTIYWIALVMTCLLSYFLIYSRGKKNTEKKITHRNVFIAFLPLFLVALFRWNVGVDVVYKSGYYYLAYEAISFGGGNIFHYESGFYALMKLCNMLHFNLYMFYCVVTFLFYYLFTKFISENSKNIILASIIFVLSDLYLFTFSTLRQSLGIAFALYPISRMLNNKTVYKNWKWWVSVIIALSMHGTSLYLIMIVLISKIRINQRILVIITTLLCMISPFLQRILENIISHSSYFEKYFGSNMYIRSFSFTYFAIALSIFIISLFYYKKLIEDNDKNYILINACAFITILMANSKILVMPYRVFPLFVPIYIIICSKIIYTIKKNVYKYLCTILCLIIPFFLLFVNQYYIKSGDRYFIYKSIFDYPNQVWSK